MAYTIVGFTMLLGAALVGGAVDWEVEHIFSHAALAAFVTGAFMIYGADWLLQRTEWGRRHSKGMSPPDLDLLK